jgi:hypothetical protein
MGAKATAAGAVGRAAADAGGPRVDPASVVMTERQIAFATDQELYPESVTSGAITVTAFDEAEGWKPVAIDRVRLSTNGRRVSVVLRETPRAALVRLVARGSGPTPILGRTLIPLAGSPTDPQASSHDGNDFVWMKRRT